jgi:NOL1/NOP2/fmu family ribosome biogenesis protein
MGRRLLDEAEAKTWHRGEIVSVEVRQADDERYAWVTI